MRDSQGSCAILERRCGLARFSGERILSGLHWLLNALISGGRLPAYQMVLGSDQAGHYRWDDKDENPTFAQDTPISGQFVQQWKLRMMAQEAALAGIADS